VSNSFQLCSSNDIDTKYNIRTMREVSETLMHGRWQSRHRQAINSCEPVKVGLYFPVWGPD